MISVKTKYGLKAVIYLARQASEQSVLISVIAHEEKIPQKFLEAILLELRKEGILQSKKGKGGGYSLAKVSSEIMVGDIIKVLEGTIAPEFPQVHKRNSSESDYEINLIIEEVRDAMSKILDHTSIKDLLDKASRHQGVVNFMI